MKKIVLPICFLFISLVSIGQVSSDNDNDGVSNSEDLCPSVAGSKSNKGCPVTETKVKKKDNKTFIEAADFS